MNKDEYEDLVAQVAKGDAEALAALKTLAKCHYNEDPNSSKAFEFFFRAAKLDDAESQHRIGCMFYNGQSRKRDLEKAGEWLLKAYHQEYRAAMIELALMMDEGYVFAPSAFPYTSALDCMEEAANKHGLKQAQKHLRRLKRKALRPTAAERLQHMVGLEHVKAELLRLKKMVDFEKMRDEAGLSATSQSHHFAFMGNPGTGKTEVARQIGDLFKEMGLLEKGHVVEVDRAGLIGAYIGQTEEKVMEVVRSALGGVLFIDEAHALNVDSSRDYGHEAINVLVKAMEDNRDKLVVIMAGYHDEMKMMLRSNPGLKSRIRHHYTFADYSADELVAIYGQFAEEAEFVVSPEAKERVAKLMQDAVKSLDRELGNGRFARNAFDRTIEKMAVRVYNLGLSDKDSLETIRFTDVPNWAEISGKQAAHTGEGEIRNLRE